MGGGLRGNSRALQKYCDGVPPCYKVFAGAHAIFSRPFNKLKDVRMGFNQFYLQIGKTNISISWVLVPSESLTAS